jgi:hypothetical protein
MPSGEPGDLPSSATERVIEVLAEHGDTLSTVREIDHFAYFPDVAARARYIEKCLAAGFKLRRLSEPYKPGAGFGAIIFHDDVPDEEVLLKVHALLTERAAAEGGDYDGWETQLIV